MIRKSPQAGGLLAVDATPGGEEDHSSVVASAWPPRWDALPPVKSSTFPKELQEALLHLRKLHPGWGPATLLAVLKTDPCWHDQPLPSRAQIAKLLKQAGLTRRDLPHHDLAQPPRTQLTAPHQEWQMDAASGLCGWKEWAR